MNINASHRRLDVERGGTGTDGHLSLTPDLRLVP
jgi:hypothetical protein